MRSIEWLRATVPERGPAAARTVRFHLPAAFILLYDAQLLSWLKPQACRPGSHQAGATTGSLRSTCRKGGGRGQTAVCTFTRLVGDPLQVYGGFVWAVRTCSTSRLLRSHIAMRGNETL